MGRSAAQAALLRRRGTMALLVAAAVPGCVWPGGQLYVLTPVPGPMLTGAPMTLAVRGVSLPQMLQRAEIVRATEFPPSPVAANGWWAEPLDLMIGRVLGQDLIQRLPGTRVFLDPRPPYTPCDTWIELTVLRFDTNEAGDAIVQAEIQVAGLRLLTRSAWKRITPASGSTEALVTALSIALGHFADLAATLVVESWAVAFR